MKKPSLLARARRKHITSADVGKFLKALAAVQRDSLTGNPAMSDALAEIASVLLAGKAMPAAGVLQSHRDQQNFDFEEEFSFESLSLGEVRDILARPDLTKAELTIIGIDRFGIAKSRLDRSTRDELIQAITSAAQHEESLTIISEEAQRHSRLS